MAQVIPGTDYTVKSGDSISWIAEQAYGDPSQWQVIYNANRRVIGPSAGDIRPGQVLFIPVLQTPEVTTYTVQSGDTPSSIAQHFYGDANQWQKIYDTNKQVIGPNPDIIHPGQVLVIP